MKRPEAPCLFCCGRHLGCHAECEAYKEFEHARKEYREHITKQKVEENQMKEIEIKRFTK